MKKNDRGSWKGLIALGALVLIFFVFTIEQSRTFLIALFVRSFVFAKHHLITILSAFFLVKGKFIFSIFIKKIAILSATGLSKRYFIEKVLNHHIKIHFLDHIQNDMKRLISYIKRNFRNFPLIKQLLAAMAFFSSLGFVGKFMGWMIAMKVFVAKFWSFLLAVFLKTGTAVIYFFTDYVWGSWIAPILEVLIFSWMLEWLEKVPFLKGFFASLYHRLFSFIKKIELIFEKLFHIPVRDFFAWLAKWVKHWIEWFMNEKKVSSWYYLQQIRVLKPNLHTLIKQKRKGRKQIRLNKPYRSSYQKMIQKRLNRAQ